MSLSLGFFTFLNVWWLMLFFVLPFSMHTQDNQTHTGYAAAPPAQRWKHKLLTNTVLSIIVTLTLALIINTGLIPLHGME